MEYKVIKRSGDIEPFDFDKIYTHIKYACKGLRVDENELIENLKIRMKEEMSSVEIHKNLVITAQDLTSKEKPDWQYAAARLELQSLYKSIYGSYNPKFTYKDLVNRIDRKLYDAEILEDYTEDEINEIFNAIKYERDLNFTYLGLSQMLKKYGIRRDGEPIETPQEVFMLVPLYNFSKMKNKKKRMQRVKKYYNKLSTFKLFLSTPPMIGLRTETRGFTSCAGIHYGDSIESIGNAYKSMITLVTKLRAGIGADPGGIRGLDADIKEGTEVHTGITPYLKVGESISRSSTQPNSGRSGAVTNYYPFFHWEIEQILTLKNNKGSDENSVRFSDHAINFNDLFYERVVEDKDITVFHMNDVGDLYERIGYDDFKEKYEALERKRGIKKKKYKARYIHDRYFNERYITAREYKVNSTAKQRHGAYDLPNYKSNLCFTGDTVVAVADGRNGVSIKELAEMSDGTKKFQVYSGEKVETEKIVKRNGGHTYLKTYKPVIKDAIAFFNGRKNVVTVELSNGDTFRCTEDHELYTNDGRKVEAKNSIGEELESIFSYTPTHKSPYRFIDTISNVSQKQSIMIYDHHNKNIEPGFHIDHIENDIFPYDSIDNLQKLSKEAHLEKTKKERIGENNPIHRMEKDNVVINNLKERSYGKQNPKFCGIDNFELIDIAKQYKSEHSLERFTKKDYSDLVKEFEKKDGIKLPSYFSKYRFNGSKDIFIKYVNEELKYEGELEKEKIILKRKDNRIKAIEDTFYEFIGNDVKRKGLTVVNVIDNGEVEDVYDLTVDDNHNFYILTSTEDEKYNNSCGVLVSNCTEISNPSFPDENFHFKAKSAKEVYDFVDNLYEIGEWYQLYRYIYYDVVDSENKIIVKQFKNLLTDSKDGEEVTLNFGEIFSCILGGFNMGELPKDVEKRRKEIKEMMFLQVAFLDDMIDYQDYVGLTAFERFTKNRRSLGISPGNLFYFLAKNDAPYDSQKARDLVNEVMEEVLYYAIEASVELAKERGACKWFADTKYSKGIFPIDTYERNVDELVSPELKLDWGYLREQVKEHGMRHSTLLTAVPSSNSSRPANMISGVNPPQSLEYNIEDQKMKISGVLPEVDKYLEFYEKSICWEIDQIEYMKLIAVFQKFIDQTISLNEYVDFTKYPEMKIPKSEVLKRDFFMQKFGIETAYYAKTRTEEDEKELSEEASECGSGGCAL